MSRSDATTVTLPNHNPFAEPDSRAGQSGGRSGTATTVNLPNHNPFAESDPRAGRSGGRSSIRATGGRAALHAQSDDDEESDDDEYGGSRDNMIRLPSNNPFSQSEVPRARPVGAQSGGRPTARRGPRAQHADDTDRDHVSDLIVLPNENPFASSGNRSGRRIIEPVYPPTESESESESEYDGKDSVHVPPASPRASAIAQEDDRVVVS